MRTRYRHYGRTWYRRGPLGFYPRGAMTLPWGRYERSAYLFWRIRIPLWLAGAAAGWALAGPGGIVAGLAAAYVLEGPFSFRRAGIPGSAARPQPASPTDAEVAAAHAVARRWDTEAVPSPDGWQPPAGVLPAWAWLPPGGIAPRLDRVPRWVRVWYRTPLVDRYAYVWMWNHGGWDVLPPGPEPDVSQT